MKRINILYGGAQYSVGGRELSHLEAEIEKIVQSGTPGWLTVNFGEGSVRPARLLITAGTQIALIGIDPEGDAAGSA